MRHDGFFAAALTICGFFTGSLAHAGTPTRITPSVQSGVSALTVDHHVVYWGETASHEIFKTSLSESGPATLVTTARDVVGQLVVHDGFLYWRIDYDGIYRMALTPGAPVEQIVRDPLTNWPAYGIDEDYLYWMSDEAAPAKSTVKRRSLSTGTVETVTTLNQRFNPSGFAFDQDHVYFSYMGGSPDMPRSGGVFVAPKAGGTARAVATDQRAPTDLVMVDGRLYWINYDEAAAFVQYDPATQTVTSLVKGLLYPRGLSQDEGDLYFTDMSAPADAIHRYRPTTAEDQIVYRGNDYAAGVNLIGFDDSVIIWGTGTSPKGQVVEMSLDDR